MHTEIAKMGPKGAKIAPDVAVYSMRRNGSKTVCLFDMRNKPVLIEAFPVNANKVQRGLVAGAAAEAYARFTGQTRAKVYLKGG